MDLIIFSIILFLFGGDMGFNDISIMFNDPILQILLIVLFFLIVLCLMIIVYSLYREKKYNKSQEEYHNGEEPIKDENNPYTRNNSSITKSKSTTERATHTTQDANDTITEQTDFGEEGNAPTENRESEDNSPSEKIDENNETIGFEEKTESATMDTPPKSLQFSTMITVKKGIFVEADSCDAIYYKSWTEKGKKYFEFVNNDRTKKAINNRSILIEPFCIKMEESISPDEADMIETKKPGILSDDYTVIEKAKIIYK